MFVSVRWTPPAAILAGERFDPPAESRTPRRCRLTWDAARRAPKRRRALGAATNAATQHVFLFAACLLPKLVPRRKSRKYIYKRASDEFLRSI